MEDKFINTAFKWTEELNGKLKQALRLPLHFFNNKIVFKRYLVSAIKDAIAIQCST